MSISRESFFENILLTESKGELITKLREYLKKHPLDIPMFIKLGDTLRELGRPLEALEIHRKLIVSPTLRKSLRKRILSSCLLYTSPSPRD